MTLALVENAKLADLAKSIRFRHQKHMLAVGSALDWAHGAGVDLIEAKKLVPHGQWTSWIEEHCNFSDRTAQAYMRVARRITDLGWEYNSPKLTLEEALERLAEPKTLKPEPQAPAVLPNAEVPFELQPELIEPTGPAAYTDLITDHKLSMVAATIRDYDRQTAIIKRAELLDLRAAIDAAIEKAGDA